jgi:hypothetical protein
MKNQRRSFLKTLAGATVLTAGIGEGIRPAAGSVPAQVRAAEVPGYRKIDIHMHVSSDAPYLREIMDGWNLKMFTICNEALKTDRLEAQIRIAIELSSTLPRYYGWCTTFDLMGIGERGWTPRVRDELRRDFDNGALAVKVWKEIGMQLRDTRGRFIQIDDAVFNPVFDFIAASNKTLFMHIGDPPDYWLSAGPDGQPDAWYREGNGIWNRIGEFRGEVPFHSLMQATDGVLARYPHMKAVGCHLGSLAYDLDELARRMDRFPQYAVETSFTLSLLMGQAREKVRNFFMKYQDRILYGSDISGGLVATPFLVDMSKIDQRWSEAEVEKIKADHLAQYQREYEYFATDREFDRGDYAVHGLALPEAVLRKLYYDNALRWVPGVERGF